MSRSGTPAYMAPEQLAGREATQQSDLYALGLVLYEAVYGASQHSKRGTFEELLRLRESQPVATPSTLIPDLDHRIERAILRCLEPDPQLRPASRSRSPRSLPGGDPLAEALAAGETPSPEMIAAAGPTEGLQPRAALMLLACIVVSITTVLTLTPSTTVLGKVPLQVPPEELTIRARDLARDLGFTDIPVDVAAGFDYDAGYLTRAAQTIKWIKQRTATAMECTIGVCAVADLVHLRPESRPLHSTTWRGVGALPASEALLEPGRITTTLDLEGRLLSIERTPTPADLARPTTDEPDWTALFTAAGLDIARFSRSSAEPRLEIADSRIAWTGPYLDANQTPVRIEASSFRGVVSSFAVVYSMEGNVAGRKLAGPALLLCAFSDWPQPARLTALDAGPRRHAKCMAVRPVRLWCRHRGHAVRSGFGPGAQHLLFGRGRRHGRTDVSRPSSRGRAACGLT